MAGLKKGTPTSSSRLSDDAARDPRDADGEGKRDGSGQRRRGPDGPEGKSPSPMKNLMTEVQMPTPRAGR